jgi:hypothetical protein
MAIIKPEEMDQNVAQAPTLGRQAGAISQGGGMQPQRRNVSQRGSGFTNLQQYVTANENNANPEIVRQRTAQAGTGLQQAQTGFENVAQQARTGLQGIQGVNTFVQGVLADPTKAAANQTDLQRFQALRTGTQRIANPTDVLQPFTQAQTGFESQREQLAGGLRTDTTGTGLQNYIRSQRANPSLATQGENVLDRFLTESTTAGKTALQQAQERAGQIQATQIPGISGEVEALRQQVEPLQFRTQQGIQSGINPLVKEQENFITGLNKNYVAQQLGLNVGDAEYIRQQADKYNQNINEIQGAIASGNQELNNLNNAINFENAVVSNPNTTVEQKDRARTNLQRFRNQAREREQAINRDAGYLQSQREGRDIYLGRNQPILDKLNTYNENIGKTRQQLLQAYDLPRLQRVQALQSLSGQDLSSLLSQGVS